MNKYDSLIESVLNEAIDIKDLISQKESLMKSLSIVDKYYQDQLKSLNTEEDWKRKDAIHKQLRKNVSDRRNRIFKEIEKIDRKIDQDKYGVSELKKVLRKLKIKAAKFRGTAIRGYSEVSEKGYELNKYQPELVTFYGYYGDNWDKIIKELKAAGLDFEHSKPSKVITGDWVSDITLKPLNIEVSNG